MASGGGPAFPGPPAGQRRSRRSDREPLNRLPGAGQPRACTRPSRRPAGWLGTFGCGAAVPVVLCPQQVRIGHGGWRCPLARSRVTGSGRSRARHRRRGCRRGRVATGGRAPGGNEGCGAGGTGRAGGQRRQPPQLTPLMATAQPALPAPGPATARHHMRAGLGRGPTAEGSPRHLAEEQVNHVHSAPTSPGRRALAVILAIIGVWRSSQGFSTWPAQRTRCISWWAAFIRDITWSGRPSHL